MKFILSFILSSAISLLMAHDFNPLITTPKKTKFAIMIASYNNEQWVEWNLASAINQEYDSKFFHIYYLNDCSTDNTLEMAKNLVAQMNKEHLVTFVNNSEKSTSIGNYYSAIHSFVPDDHVVVILDGDDALAHSKVLNYLDRIYRNKKNKTLLTYGQFKCKSSNTVGWCSPMPKQIDETCSFRQYVHLPSHLRTFYAWLFKKIKKEDLFYDGKFLTMSGDVGSMMPMIEMALGHYQFINDVLYIYNDTNPISDHNLSKAFQEKIDRYVRSLPRYEPLDPIRKRYLDRTLKELSLQD
ncbi:MAG: glycosyltransferase family 2 protein [Simkaniaceae bacterium]|nr:glycosyltransferase family 2 protein [Simkaniaceae bacterium]MCF7852173.1 glycosyltransferase family 2 protein [Simkaniaceae bacterium]